MIRDGRDGYKWVAIGVHVYYSLPRQDAHHNEVRHAGGQRHLAHLPEEGAMTDVERRHKAHTLSPQEKHTARGAASWIRALLANLNVQARTLAT